MQDKKLTTFDKKIEFMASERKIFVLQARLTMNDNSSKQKCKQLKHVGRKFYKQKCLKQYYKNLLLRKPLKNKYSD